jgi:hypothetical protein
MDLLAKTLLQTDIVDPSTNALEILPVDPKTVGPLIDVDFVIADPSTAKSFSMEVSPTTDNESPRSTDPSKDELDFTVIDPLAPRFEPVETRSPTESLHPKLPEVVTDRDEDNAQALDDIAPEVPISPLTDILDPTVTPFTTDRWDPETKP